MRVFSITKKNRSKIKRVYWNSFREIKNSVPYCMFTVLEYNLEKEKSLCV